MSALPSAVFAIGTLNAATAMVAGTDPGGSSSLRFGSGALGRGTLSMQDSDGVNPTQFNGSWRAALTAGHIIVKFSASGSSDGSSFTTVGAFGFESVGDWSQSGDKRTLGFVQVVPAGSSTLTTVGHWSDTYYAPTPDNAVDLGELTTPRRWRTVYAYSGDFLSGLVVGGATVASTVDLGIYAAADQSKELIFYAGAHPMWIFRCENSANDLYLLARDDSGNAIDIPISISRAAGGAITLVRRLNVVAGTTATASLRIPHGAAPTSPVNGDVWTTTAGLFVRVNGVTVGPLT